MASVDKSRVFHSLVFARLVFVLTIFSLLVRRNKEARLSLSII